MKTIKTLQSRTKTKEKPVRSCLGRERVLGVAQHAKKSVPLRAGWAQAARALVAKGAGSLVMGEFANEGDVALMPLDAMMTARDAEAAMLYRCAVVARYREQCARNQREANVFGLAASVIRSRFPAESSFLFRASQEYFEAHPDERLTAAEVVGRGWVVSLPRLRDMLCRRLSS